MNNMLKVLLVELNVLVGLLVFFPLFCEEKVLLCFLSFMILEFFFGGGGLEFFMDDLSFSMVSLSLVMSGVVLFFSESNLKHFFVSLIFFLVGLFFMEMSMYLFFIFFEMSLVPIFFFIILWGVQPERLKAVKFMMIYTLVASSPLLMCIFFLSSKIGNSLDIVFVNVEASMLIPILCTIAFWVKVPVFFFHSWLPKAHVEAPLEGSMILAGIMLKMGVYGYIRMLSLFSWEELKVLMNLSFCFGLIGSLLSVWAALSSDDMKMSVAFSSISHMNLCIAGAASLSTSSINGLVLVMISHGFCSPLLFIIVTKIYEFSGSRSLLISKGLVSKFSLFQFFSFLIWGMNISIPPFVSFIGELMVFMSIFHFSLIGMGVVGVYLIFMSFFSMMVFGVQFHSSYKFPLKKDFFSLLFCLISLSMILGMVIMFFKFDFFFLEMF